MSKDGWTTAGSSAKSKKKKGGGANGKKLNADSGAPMNMRQVELTGFAKAEAMALEKAKRKQAAAVEKVKAKDRKVQEEQAREDRRKQKLIDQYDTGGRKGGKKKKKTVEATPIEDAVKALNFAKIEEAFADGQARFPVSESRPGAQVEHLKMVAGEMHRQLAKCENVADELEMLDSPLKYLAAEGHERIGGILDQCDAASMAPIFAVCAKTAADLAKDGMDSVGIMLLIQLLVQRESEKGGNMILQSLPMVVGHFYTKVLYPTEKQLVAIVRIYTQSVKIPGTYIRFWVMFFLYARPDKLVSEQKNEPVLHSASKTVARLATAYFGLVLDGSKKHDAVVKAIFAGKAPLRPQELWFLLVLAHGDTPGGADRDELLRAVPYFLQACLEKAAGAYFADLLPYFSKAPIQQLRDFLVACAMKESKCFAVMDAKFEKFPVETMHAFVSVVQRSTGTSNAFRNLMTSTAKSIGVQNAALKAAELAKKHPKQNLIKRTDYHANQLDAVEETLKARSGTHPVLWLMLLLSATLFFVLFFHLLCQLKQVAALEGPCRKFEGGELFASIERFYVQIEPVAAQAEVHGSAAYAAVKEATAPAVDAASPHISAAWETVSELAAPSLAAVEEATRGARESASSWINTVAWPLIVLQLEAAAPVISDANELFLVALGRAWAKLGEVWGMAADAAEPAMKEIYPALEAGWKNTADAVGPALEDAQKVAVQAFNAAYDKAVALIS